MSGARGRESDKRRIIEWLEENLEFYKNNIGETVEHGRTNQGVMSTTVIDQRLIDTVEERIKKLKEKELELV